ncbi:hypothetical protein NE237_032527 [Protea cynaroides]|uniref:SAWADEE domain-containing protein n=1 Tax=Protea cynaroides TaxID=273540 RepID=A0A9Q0R3M6_9MAGN|nr:hypothetical protein NE237_032527 [Protea cynaroides]
MAPPRSPNRPEISVLQSTHLEFRCPSDDAWYGVRLLLRGDTLTVKYNDFSEIFDERFCASDFKTLSKIHALRDRFRLASVQLQDNQCSQVIEGVVVCVSHCYSQDDIRFYDAFIHAVNNAEHRYVNGEEECTCFFKVLWRHGPLDGIHTQTKIGNICRIQSGNGERNATLASFLKMSREKLEMASHSVLSSPRRSFSVCKDASNETHGSTGKQSDNGCTSKGRGKWHSKGTWCTARTCKGSIKDTGGKIGQDVDLGGEPLRKKTEDTGNFYFILIDNMEKDLSSLVVVDFIYRHTSVLSHAYVFPSLLLEPFTRGVIVVDSRGKLEKIWEFLHDPTHIIISSRGRPWVSSEKMLRHGAFPTSFWGIMSKSEDEHRNRNAESDDIKVIQFGTKEYMKADLLKESFMLFVDDLRGLYCKLASDENEILQSFL